MTESDVVTCYVGTASQRRHATHVSPNLDTVSQPLVLQYNTGLTINCLQLNLRTLTHDHARGFRQIQLANYCARPQ